MTLPTAGWRNAVGTQDDRCPCNAWKDHWIRNSCKTWPPTCSVENCTGTADVGAHVEHSAVQGTWIVPMCDSCNGLDGSFNLKGGVTLIKAISLSGCGQD